MYRINLLPVELQRDLSIDIKGLVRRVTVIITILLLLASYGVFLFMGYLTKKEINDTEKYLNQISSAVKKVEGIKAQRVKNEESTKKYKELLSTRQARFPLLEDLSYNMPVDLWLENVVISYVEQNQSGKSGQSAKTATNASGGASQPQPAAQSQTQGQAAVKKEPVSPPEPNTLIIEGYSLTVPSIGIFMNNLYLMPYFSSVVLNELNKDKTSGNIKFKLTAVLKESGR